MVRPLAGVAALSYPVILIWLAIDTGFRSDGGLGDLAGSLLAAVLFLVAVPTAWVFAPSFVDVSQFTVVAVGAVTSLPLWYLLGARLADGARSWGRWFVRYTMTCVAWTAANILVLVLVARFVS